MTALVLGGFVFQDFEIPESFPFGGSQAGHLHKLPGGVRIFDATGPDDEEITWSGRFRGASARDRALQLDGMRRAGGPLQLSALDLSFTVVIKSFKPTIKRPWEIEYTISLIVIADNNQGVDSTIPASLDSLVGSDIAEGLLVLGSIDAGISAAVSAFQAAIAAVSSLQEAGAYQLQPVQMAAYALENALAAAANAQEDAILNDPIASDPLDTGPAALLASLAALETEATILNAGAYFGRAAANVLNSVG